MGYRTESKDFFVIALNGLSPVVEKTYAKGEDLLLMLDEFEGMGGEWRDG